MEDYANNIEVKNSQAADNVGLPADDLPIKTPVRYDTAFSLLIAPLMGARYIWPAIAKLNPWSILQKLPSKLSENFASTGMGATFLGIIGLYSRNTLHDIHSLYSEAVGYELGKPKEDVTYRDIFVTSNNSALSVTRSNYINRTAARLATTIPFFVPWHRLDLVKNHKPYAANPDLGTGTVGIYLLGEGFLRKPSFFDAEQKLVSTAINHTDNKTNEKIQPKDIAMLLMLQHNHTDKDYKWPNAASEAGRNENALAQRISDLMNQTYHNINNAENAGFTIGKFNYLVGFGLLDKFPESLAFVELANKSKDMSEVKYAAAAIKNGQDSQSVFRNFGIDTNSLVKSENAEANDINVATQKFVSNVRQISREPIMPKSMMDYAAHTTELKLG